MDTGEPRNWAVAGRPSSVRIGVYLCDRGDRRPEAAGEEQRGPLGREGACDGAADRAAGSVDHHNLVLQHHLRFPSVPGLVTPAHLMS